MDYVVILHQQEFVDQMKSHKTLIALDAQLVKSQILLDLNVLLYQHQQELVDQMKSQTTLVAWNAQLVKSQIVPELDVSDQYAVKISM